MAWPSTNHPATPLSDFDESLETGAMATPPRTPSARAPEHFGEYLLVELLGRGGMAHVYQRGSEEMALKRPLVSFLEEPQFRDRFLREAEIGTPEYVSPETAEGHGSYPRSDLYSLGVVLYEILTAQRPFVGESPYATIRKHCTEPPARYPSAEELLIELQQYLNRACT